LPELLAGLRVERQDVQPGLVRPRAAGDVHAVADDHRARHALAGQVGLPPQVLVRRPTGGEVRLGRDARAAGAAELRPVVGPGRQGNDRQNDEEERRLHGLSFPLSAGLAGGWGGGTGNSGVTFLTGTAPPSASVTRRLTDQWLVQGKFSWF